MTAAWRDNVKQLLPGAVLTRVQAARWALRRFRHRLRWLASRRRGRGIGIGTFDGRCIAYRLHSVDTAVLHHSFDNDIFFRAVPDLVIDDAAVILDIGAHIGTFALLASEKAPRGRIYAVEASRETFTLLKTNIELNGRRNITAEHLAIAGSNQRVRLHHDPEGNYGHSITRQLSDSSEEVDGVSLARLLDDRGIAAAALAKFNCEGAEFPSLLAAPAAVLRRITTMLVLYHCDLAEQPVTALTGHLAAAGFRIELREESADRGWIIARRT